MFCHVTNFKDCCKLLSSIISCIWMRFFNWSSSISVQIVKTQICMFVSWANTYVQLGFWVYWNRELDHSTALCRMFMTKLPHAMSTNVSKLCMGVMWKEMEDNILKTVEAEEYLNKLILIMFNFFSVPNTFCFCTGSL